MFSIVELVSYLQNKIIQHKFNSGEVRLTEYSLPVDGYCEEEKLVFQFDGCVFHSCSVYTTNQNPDGSLQETNPFNNLKHEDIRKKTEENTKILQDAGYQVIRMRECTWKKVKTNPHIVSFLKNLKTVTPKRQLSFQKILERIEDESLFGLAIVDIHTPEELKPEFDEFPLIVKNTLVPREDIGEYMGNIAKEPGFLKKPKRALISSHFGVEVLVSTTMAKYYLEKGRKITRMYEFIQFYPEKCFEKLANQISDNRRAADDDISKTILGLTSKLIGNSLYSASLLNKEKHRNITYCDNETVNKAINNPRFVNLEVVTPGVYEIKSLKKSITNDQALQVDLMVHLNAKLHLFQFYYEFMKKFLDPKKYCFIETDTDSIYCALSEESMDLCVKPECKKEFFTEQLKWMPLPVCDAHKQEFIASKVSGIEWKLGQCCKDRLKY